MQISSASLLAAQQTRAQPAPKQAAKPSDELFEPLFGKQPEKVAEPAEAKPAPQQMMRPGSQIDIRV